MAEIQRPTISALASSGQWGISRIESVVEISANAVGTFLDGLPEEHRGFAMDAIEARIEVRREALRSQDAEQRQD